MPEELKSCIPVIPELYFKEAVRAMDKGSTIFKTYFNTCNKIIAVRINYKNDIYCDVCCRLVYKGGKYE